MKRYYDFVRPITGNYVFFLFFVNGLMVSIILAIRYMGMLGQSSDPKKVFIITLFMR